MKHFSEPSPSLASADVTTTSARNIHREMAFDEYFDNDTSSSIPSVINYYNIDLYSANDQLRCNQNLQIERHLGSGSFSDVYLAKLNGIPVAVKVLKTFTSEKQHQTFTRELSALQRTRDNSRTLDLIAYRPAPHYWLITNFMNQGSLSNLLKTTPLNWEQKINILHQLASALLSLHQMDPPLFHRDVTSENILFDGGRLRLGDFGVAVDAPSSSFDPAFLLSPNGNPKYRAPEVRHGSSYSLAAEVYNFGSVLYEILTGQAPFGDLPPKEVLALRQAGQKPTFDMTCSPDPLFAPLYQLLEACWATEPASRPSFPQILAFLEELHRSHVQSVHNHDC